MADKRNHCRTKGGKRKQNAQSEGCGQSKLFKRSGSCGQGSDNAALHRMALIHALNLQHPHVGRVNAPRPQRTCDLHMLHEGCLQALKHVWNCSSLSHKLVQNFLQKHATPTPAAHNLISVFFQQCRPCQWSRLLSTSSNEQSCTDTGSQLDGEKQRTCKRILWNTKQNVGACSVAKKKEATHGTVARRIYCPWTCWR